MKAPTNEQLQQLKHHIQYDPITNTFTRHNCFHKPLEGAVIPLTGKKRIQEISIGTPKKGGWKASASLIAYFLQTGTWAEYPVQMMVEGQYQLENLRLMKPVIKETNGPHEAKKFVDQLEYLRSWFSYNPETGEIFNRKLNRVVGSKINTGYIEISFNINGERHRILAHRLAWFLFTGSMPHNYIDHINRDKVDNRILNLHCVSHAVNMQNVGIKSNNTSGHQGVSFNKATGRWEAYITLNKKRKRLGYYENIDDAVAARKQAEQDFQYY